MKARIFTDKDVRKMLDKSVRDAAEMGVNAGEKSGLRQGFLQGVGVSMLVLELERGWKKTRLQRFAGQVQEMISFPPTMGKAATAAGAIDRMRDLYGIDLDKLEIEVDVDYAD